MIKSTIALMILILTVGCISENAQMKETVEYKEEKEWVKEPGSAPEQVESFSKTWSWESKD